jgi:SAM-dependent methyltransferase
MASDTKGFAEALAFIKNATKGSEIEVSLSTKKPLTLQQYVHLLETHVKRHKEGDLKVLKEISLDVAYNYDHEKLCSHRITIYDLKDINEVLNSVSLRENHVVFSILLNKSKNSSSISSMTKTRTKSDIIDVPDLGIRLRNSKEEPIPETEMKKLLQLHNSEKAYITYRFKERLSLYIHDDDNGTIKTDVTKVRQSQNMKLLPNAIPRYEIEVEFAAKTKITTPQKYYDILEKEMMLINKIIQGSWQVIGVEETEGIGAELKKLMMGDGTVKSDLPGMQPKSLEIPQLVDSIPSKYSVTDKADGDRYFLFIKDSNVYLVSTNMAIKKIDSDKKYKEWDNSVIDGEYIYIPDKNKYIYLGFDMMFYKGLDIRNEYLLEKRLEKMYETMNKVFDQEVLPEKSHNMKQQEKTMREYMKDLNKKLNKKSNVVIMGKYFIMPEEKDPTTIFGGSSLMWRLYTSDKDFGCPYILDGLIYTSTEQKYTALVKEQMRPIYKWKPNSKNSIDFYVEFEKDEDTGQILNVYDNTVDEETTGEDDSALEGKAFARPESDIRKVYRILKLFVGKSDGGREYPVLFQKDNGNYIAKLYVDKGEVRDIEGKMIQDKTVVEFAYNSDPKAEKNFRWIPLRTRFDKTEWVQRFKRKYGNNEYVAEGIWRSMMDPVEIADIDLLGNAKTYDSQKKLLESKIKADALLLQRKNDAYYQEVSKELSRTMTQFHNYVKTCMINTYCKAKFGKKYSVLDIACGRGGDLNKFYHARVAYYVGVDEDPHGINSVLDGAKKRYSDIKRTKPDAPKMEFFTADANLPLTYNDQYTKYGKLLEQDKRQMTYYFGESLNDEGKQFDIINCQLALHYFLKDDTTWNNYMTTVKRHLKKGGYFMFTTLDGNRVNNVLKKTGRMTEHYTSDDGKQKLLYEIVRMYPETTNNLKSTGLTINVHMSWISQEGVYIPEYLVEPSYVIQQLEEQCDLTLIETETFGSFMETHRHFYTDVYQYESNESLKKTMINWAEYYNTKDPLIASLNKYTQLHRYYIFRKN